MKCFVSVLLAALLLLTACAGGSPAAPEVSADPAASSSPVSPEPAPEPEPPARPAFAWPEAGPGEMGMDAGLLSSMEEALKDSHVTAALVVRRGAVVSEWYAEGFDENTVFPMHSCSKSFTGAIVGAALEDGFIRSLEDPISQYLPQAAGTDKAEITLRQLLCQTSGIRWYEWNGREDSFMGLMRAENWVDYVLSQPLDHDPGTVFTYTTGGSHLLSAVVQAATGRTAAEYGAQRLFSRMDMDSVSWHADPQGITDGGNGVRLTPRDAAKLGQLYLNGGVWEGERLLSEEWIRQSVSRQSAGSGGRSGEYGYQWWLRSFSGYPTWYAMGYGGQFIFVTPSLDLVAVFVSGGLGDTYAPWPYFTDYVLASCAP